MKIKQFLILMILSVLFINISAYAQSPDKQQESPKTNGLALGKKTVEYAKGKVLKVFSGQSSSEFKEVTGNNEAVQIVELKVLDGRYKDKVFTTENRLTPNPAYNIKVKEGSNVVLNIEINSLIPELPDIYISDLDRSSALYLALGLFFLLLLLIGGLKGLKALTSLCVTSGLVVFVLVPLILNNYPIIPSSILVAFLSTVATIFIVGGINKKSISAIIGTVGGVTFAGLISILVIKIAPLTGFSSQESIILWLSNPKLNFTGLLTGSMIIASLGAVMDVAMSIASSVNEVAMNNNKLNVDKLIKSGFNVGKDVMGTMSNTLILAYIGSFLPLILLCANAPFIKVINLNSIVTEISAAITGSIGIILCVPITSLASGYLISYRDKDAN